MALTKVKLIADGVVDVDHLAANHGITTDNIGEGSALYYTDLRVASYLTTNSYATEGFVTTAVSNLVDAAPSTLDTLNELAAALGDDPNFATTVTNSIATKLPLAGGNITGNFSVDTNTLYVDSASNNIGIGVVPRTSSVRTLEMPNWVLEDNGAFGFKVNAYYNGSNNVFINNGKAARLYSDDGYFAFFSSATGTSGGAVTFEERMRIDSSGNVKINNGSLELGSEGISSGYVYSQESLYFNVDSNNTPESSFIVFGTGRTGNSGGTELMRIDSSGNVGIGESNPEKFSFSGKELHIKGGTGVNQSAVVAVNSSQGANGFIGGYFWRNESATNEYQYRVAQISADADTGGADTARLEFYTKGGAGNFAERMRIDSSGNVGIGEQNPSVPLHVNSGGVNDVALFESTDQKATVTIQDSFAKTNLVHNVGQLQIQIDPDNVGGASRFILEIDGSEILRANNGGNVGINETSPGAQLHLSRQTTWGSSENRVININNTGTGGNINVAHNMGAITWYSGNSTPTAGIQAWRNTPASGNNVELRFDTASAGIPYERMRIGSNGYIGMGAANNNNQRLVLAAADSNGSQLRIENTRTGGGYFVVGVGDSGSNSSITPAGGLFFYNGATRMVINSSGNVGIGTTSPRTKLNVAGASANGGGVLTLENTTTATGAADYVGKIQFYGNDSGTGANGVRASIMADVKGYNGETDLVFSTAPASTTESERMRITSVGDVLFGTQGSPNGTTTYGSGFTSESSKRMLLRMATSTTGAVNLVQFNNPNGVVGKIQINGTATSYITSSDYRLKENVVPMEGALDRVDALKPSRFNFIADPEKTVDGFLAHEVAEVIPEAISGEKDAVDEEGNPIYQGIDQSKIVPLLVGAIQELKAEVDSLKAQLNG